MSRSRSLYCLGYGTNGANGPNLKGSNKVQPSRPFLLVLFASEIASEITWLRPEIARVGPEMRNVPTVSFVPNGTFRLSRD